MVWHVHNCGDTCTFQLITEMKNASATTVSDFVTRFNNVTGCTWRIGKTGVNNLFSRSVVYQCVHRAPTHAGVEFKVGERYMKRGDDSIEYICVRKNLVNNVIYMFNKKTELIECVEPCDDYFNIGSNKKSFGCKATLKVHRVIFEPYRYSLIRARILWHMKRSLWELLCVVLLEEQYHLDCTLPMKCRLRVWDLHLKDC